MNFHFEATLLELISNIISLRPVNTIADLLNEDGFSPLIAQTNLPTFSIIEVRQRRDFIRHCPTTKQYFTTYPLSFTFSNEGLRFIQDNQQKISAKLIHYYNQYIIYNFLSWIQNYILTSKEDYLIDLMASLLVFESDINIQCFFILYFISIESQPINLFQSILPFLNTVFLTKTYDQLPSYAYSLLPPHFALLFNNDTNKENMSFTPEAEQMMHFLSLVLVDKSPHITQQIAFELFQPIESIVAKKFELNSMTFFSNLSPYLSFDTKNETISLFPKNICQHIKDNPDILFKLPSTQHEIKSYKFSSRISSNFNFNDNTLPISLFFTETNPKINDIDTYLDFHKQIVTFPNVSFSAICDDLLVSYLSLISKSIGDNDDLLRNFITTFYVILNEREVDEFSLSILSAFLVFCQINNKSKQIIDIIPLIVKNRVWRPTYSVFFNSKKEFIGLNSLRHFSLEFILQQKSMEVDTFFNIINLHPILVAEICERLLQGNHFDIFLKTNDQKRFLRSICTICCSYIQKVGDTYDSDIDLGRLSLFRFLSRLLKAKENYDTFFSDAIFLTFFLGLLFEEPLQNYVLKEFKEYLINDCTDEINDNLMQSFYHAVEQIIRLFPNTEPSKHLAIKIIKTLFDVFDVKPFFSAKFSFVLRLFCDAIEEESNSSSNSPDEPIQRFELVFKFLEYIDKKDLSMDIILLLSNLINSKKLIPCDDKLFELIKGPMINNNIIVQPLLAKLFMLCFWKTSKSKVVDLFNDLCQSTSLNAIGLHEAEIDIFLVDELNNLELNDDEIDERLSLLELISNVISSPVVVQNYISLLKGDTKYLRFLNKLIEADYAIPISILPLDVVIEDEFQLEHFGTFSAIAWLFVDSDKNSMTIFRINDDDNEIVVRIDKTQLLVNNSYIFDIPLKKWFFLALTFSYEEESVIGYLNTTLIKSVPVDSIQWPNLSIRKYRMGDSNSLTGRYGSFGFIKNLAKINVRYFVEAGPRNIAEPKMSTIEYFTPQRISDVRATFLRRPDVINFAEVFLQICKIELILPLFAQLTDDTERLNQVFSVLRNSLLIDESQQNYFYEIKGFAAIAHLLVSTSFKGLTFDFYLKFFVLCQEIGFEGLRNALIRDILINFELWTHSPDLLRISDHWKNILFVGFDFVALELMNFQELLSKLRIYLFYKPLEEKYIRNDGITFPQNQVGQIRSNLIEIIINQYSQHLQMYDLLLLMSHCISCEDVEQVHDLLLLYSHLSQNITNELAQFWTKTESLVSLIILLSSNDPLLVSTTISVVKDFHRANLVPDFSFSDLMLIFFQQLKYIKVSEELIRELIELLKSDIPELFPVCCYFSLMENEKQIAEQKCESKEGLFYDLFQSIQPSEKFPQTSPFWALWAVYGAILFDNVDILSFLAQCSHQSWVELFCLIDRVCAVFNFNGDLWKQRFMNILTEIVEKNRGEDQINIYTHLVAFFIFYRKNKSHNNALLHLFKQDADYLSVETESISKIESSQTRIANSWYELIDKQRWIINWTSKPVKGKLNRIHFDVEEKLLDSPFYKDFYCFGLRLSNDGQWIDEELATKAIAISSMSTNHSKHLFMLLSHFLNRYHNKIYEADAEAVLERNLINHTLNLFTQMRGIAKATLSKATSLFSYDISQLIKHGNNILEQEKQKIITKIENSTKNWRFIWSHMTIDHAPWASLLKSNKRLYRRDFSYNSFWCPWKTKINRHFDLHEIASERRDSGNFVEDKPKPKPKSLYSFSILDDELIPSNKETLVMNDNDFIFKRVCEVIKINKIKKNQTFAINAKYFKVENKIYKMSDIKIVLWRRRKQYPTAIEIFFMNGKTLFLNFPGLTNRVVADKIMAFVPRNALFIQQSDFDVCFQQTGLTEKWRRREISNFEYLMNLNIFGGRSFNDPSQYPFLPWVLNDYRSSSIDLNDTNIYRDLSKPVGALGEERLQELINRLPELKNYGFKQYMYSCFVSAPLTIFLYLLRVEPYTTQHIALQGGRFDTPLRQFFSIPRLFDSVITQTNDYRELTPEFFFDIDFLVNKNGFDLGCVAIDSLPNENDAKNDDSSEPNTKSQIARSNSRKVISTSRSNLKSISNVELPPWADSKPINFIYMNRKALESETVSQNLHKWIDLLFGVKQRGDEAVQSFNTYDEELYDDVWDKNRDCDENQRSRIEATLDQVGQIPPQLFKSNHPQRTTLVTQNQYEESSEMNRHNLHVKRKPIITSPLFRKFKKNVLFATIYNSSRNVIQLKLVTASYEIQTIDIEFVRIQPQTTDPSLSGLLIDGLKERKAQSQIELRTHEYPPNLVQSLELNEDASSFVEINRNVVLYVANNSLDAFILNLNTQYSCRINERRQKITSVASGMNSECHHNQIFSLSLDDSRTYIFKEIENRQRDTLGFGLNLGFGFTSSSNNNSNPSTTNTDNQTLNVIESPTLERIPSNKSIKARTSSSPLTDKPTLKKANKKLSGIFSSIIGTLAGDENTQSSSQSTIHKNILYDLQFSVPTYRKAILCSALSTQFTISVSGADDGSLIVASITDGSTIRVIQLDDNRIPVHVLITPAWGFILVNSQKYVNGRQKFFLSLYSINGDELKTIPVDFQVDKGIAWTSNDGFDYVALLSKNTNKIYAFEAFYLDTLSKKDLIYNSFHKIVAFEYIKSLSVICAVSINGCFIVIPFFIDQN